MQRSYEDALSIACGPHIFVFCCIIFQQETGMFLSAALKAIAGVDAASDDATGVVIALIDSIFDDIFPDGIPSVAPHLKIIAHWWTARQIEVSTFPLSYPMILIQKVSLASLSLLFKKA
jgi:hypothetical protein